LCQSRKIFSFSKINLLNLRKNLVGPWGSTQLGERSPKPVSRPKSDTRKVSRPSSPQNRPTCTCSALPRASARDSPLGALRRHGRGLQVRGLAEVRHGEPGPPDALRQAADPGPDTQRAQPPSRNQSGALPRSSSKFKTGLEIVNPSAPFFDFIQWKPTDTWPRDRCGRAQLVLLPSLADFLHLGADL